MLLSSSSSYPPAESSSANGTDVDAYVLPAWRQIMWGLAFLTMVAVAAFGNIVVIWIVLSQQRMRTVTNYFIGERGAVTRSWKGDVLVVLVLVIDAKFLMLFLLLMQSSCCSCSCY